MTERELIERLRKPCGRTLGHGESCVVNHLCSECEQRAEAADCIEELCAIIDHITADRRRQNAERGRGEAMVVSLEEIVAEARREERERGAKVAERELLGRYEPAYLAMEIAAAIRMEK